MYYNNFSVWNRRWMRAPRSGPTKDLFRFIHVTLSRAHSLVPTPSTLNSMCCEPEWHVETGAFARPRGCQNERQTKTENR